jgi:transposase
MLTLNISKADIERANYERFYHPSAIVRKRFTVVWLLSQGYSREIAAQIAQVSASSVKNYIKGFNTSGVEGLSSLKYKGPISELDGHRVTLKEVFEKRPPRNSNEAGQRIKELTGIRISPGRVRNFLHRMGMSVRKTGHLPAKADPVKQKAFLDDTLEGLISQSLAGQCQLYFMDASHFVLGAFLGMLWCFSRVFIPSGAGRNRINVLSALNMANLEVKSVINTTYVNAGTVIELLGLLAQTCVSVPIYVVLDNARYQHCEAVKKAASELGITLVFLPSYSPNLNLIERLWKFVKKKVLYAQYYDTVEKFHQAIRSAMCRVNSDAQWRSELKTLLTPKFQTFEQLAIA